MIRVRVDDVMTDSSAWNRPRAIRRILAFQRWMEEIPGRVFHVPTILVTEIQAFPEVIEMLQEKIENSLVHPQLHGYEHIDYAKLSLSEVEKHLELSLNWFTKVLNKVPSVWASPWGARNDTMEKAAERYGLYVETTKNTVDIKKAVGYLRQGGTTAKFNDETILVHWWDRGSALLRFLECVKHGSYEDAKQWDKDNREQPIF